ncbi:MAG: metallophosphoesterase family protein [Thermoanaerobaculia bacterium]
MRSLAGLYLLMAGCVAARPPAAAPAAGPSEMAEVSGDPVLVGAGDIGLCGSSNAERTAQLLDRIPGTVFTTGDNAYRNGSPEDFARCYDPSWGRHRKRTRPSPGNHDYGTDNGSGYFGYFGAAAGLPSRGYYSYDLGAWHVVVLNSNCREAGGCQAGSRQETWLREDLAAHPARCAVAFFHHPLFSSGRRGGNPGAMHDLWKALYDGGAEIVVNGHDHDYERFAPQDPSGAPDRERGIREFVVGTGGAALRSFPRLPIANSEVRDHSSHGVLKLTLHADGYDWEFIPSAGGSFTDSGSGTCH